jgi:hypothetical protein
MKKIFISICLLWSNFILAQVSASMYLGTAPRWITLDMENNSCEPIQNFYDPGYVRLPPYAYLNDESSSFAYLCERNRGKNKLEFLLVAVDKKYDFKNCNKEIKLWQYGHPGGGIYIERSNASGDWILIEDGNDIFSEDSIKLVNDNFKSYMIIIKGETKLKFICHNKNWYVNSSKDH